MSIELLSSRAKARYTSAMKKLYRSKSDKKIAGVCGGLGKYFGIDPTVIRIGFVLLALPGGLPGVLPYLLLAIIIPQEP
jgi:phage shock protein PspC (stress-responsive transcriptional regulator)